MKPEARWAGVPMLDESTTVAVLLPSSRGARLDESSSGAAKTWRPMARSAVAHVAATDFILGGITDVGEESYHWEHDQPQHAHRYFGVNICARLVPWSSIVVQTSQLKKTW